MKKHVQEKIENILEPLMIIVTPIFAIVSVITTFYQTSILSVVSALLAIYTLLLYVVLNSVRKTKTLNDSLKSLQSDTYESIELLKVLSIQSQSNELKLRKLTFDKYSHLYEALGTYCSEIKDSIDLNRIDINKKPFSMLDFVQSTSQEIRATSFGNVSNWWSKYESKRYSSETCRKIHYDKIIVKRLFISETDGGFDDEMKKIILQQKYEGIIVKTINKRKYRDLLLKYDSRTDNKIEDFVIIDDDLLSVSEVDAESGDDIVRYISLAIDENSKKIIAQRIKIFDNIFDLADST